MTGFTGLNCPTCGCIFKDYNLADLCGNHADFEENNCICHEGYDKDSSSVCRDRNECEETQNHNCNGNRPEFKVPFYFVNSVKILGKNLTSKKWNFGKKYKVKN